MFHNDGKIVWVIDPNWVSRNITCSDQNLALFSLYSVSLHVAFSSVTYTISLNMVVLF